MKEPNLQSGISTLSASNSNVEGGTDFGLVGRTGDPLLFDF